MGEEVQFTVSSPDDAERDWFGEDKGGDRFGLDPGALDRLDQAVAAGREWTAVPQFSELNLSTIDGWDLRLTRYQHTKLTGQDDIRIVSLLPQEDWLQIQEHSGGMHTCEIVHRSLASRPKYSAVSYAWGDISLKNCSPIHIRDSYCLMVTNSLLRALYQFNIEESNALWIDQICINQYDQEERKQQVGLMASIFEQAENTLVWLGKGDASTEAAYEVLERFSACGLADSWYVYDLCRSANSEQLERHLVQGGVSLESLQNATRGFATLMKSTWFTRRWTYQEIILSKDAIFFVDNALFTKSQLFILSMIAAMYDTNMAWQNRHIQHILLQSTRTQVDNPPLLSILNSADLYHYQCSVPHDYIYALLSLQPAHGSPGHCAISAEYTKPIQEVLIDTANALLRNGASLDFLDRHRVGQRVNRLTKLPSWVPDWTARDVAWKIHDAQAFDAAGGQIHKHIDCDNGSLLLRGKQVNQIARVASHSFRDHKDDYDADQLDKYLGTTSLLPQMLAKLQEVTKSSEQQQGTHLDLLLATLTCGRLGSHADDERPVLTNLEDIESAVRNHGEDCSYRCVGLKLALLEDVSSPIALVPEFARTGDCICILHGATTPIVLRRIDGRYEFIGQCYVEGLMYGEAVNWHQDSGDIFELV